MSTTFVRVGNFWVNLDQVNGIELVPDPHDPTKMGSARIHYANCKSQDFTAPADVQDLASWLLAHNASVTPPVCKGRMRKTAIIVGALPTNRDPLEPNQFFENVSPGCHTLEEGIQAAQNHFGRNFLQPGAKVKYRIYKCVETDGSTHAIVEVYDSWHDMSFLGLYKVIANKYFYAP